MCWAANTSITTLALTDKTQVEMVVESKVTGVNRILESTKHEVKNFYNVDKNTFVKLTMVTLSFSKTVPVHTHHCTHPSQY